MRRKIYEKMVEWKEQSDGTTALLIDGARRVGKSYIVEQFAKDNYSSYLLIDFNKLTDEVKSLFDDYLDDLDALLQRLMSYYGVNLEKRKSAIIFDEVQLFPRARSAIKYLVADGRYDYIETGSLVSIKENTKEILIPSEEQHLEMYPMDFEEYLWAMGNDALYDYIRECYKKGEALHPAIHRKAMDNFREYMIVGGMPQVVVSYRETRDFAVVDQIKRNILGLYRDDMRKHAGKYGLKVERVFDSIPSQLQRQERRYKITSLGKDAKRRDYDDAFMWLDDAMIVNMCFNTTEPSIGLSMNLDRSAMKCYMADTGLLISHAFDEKGLVDEEVYKKILFNKLSFDGGAIAENVVAQVLRSSGHKLYFYYNNPRDDSDERMEIDFLITKSKVTNKHNIIPIEVKSGKQYKVKSLDKYCKKYSEQVAEPIVVHFGDYMKKDGRTYLPVYMVGLL